MNQTRKVKNRESERMIKTHLIEMIKNHTPFVGNSTGSDYWVAIYFK